jgi:hypothetical protein
VVLFWGKPEVVLRQPGSSKISGLGPEGPRGGGGRAALSHEGAWLLCGQGRAPPSLDLNVLRCQSMGLTLLSLSESLWF